VYLTFPDLKEDAKCAGQELKVVDWEGVNQVVGNWPTPCSTVLNAKPPDTIFTGICDGNNIWLSEGEKVHVNPAMGVVEEGTPPDQVVAFVSSDPGRPVLFQACLKAVQPVGEMPCHRDDRGCVLEAPNE